MSGGKGKKRNRQGLYLKNEALREAYKARSEERNAMGASEYQQREDVMFTSCEGLPRFITSLFAWIGVILFGIAAIILLSATPEERRVYTTATIEQIEEYRKSDGETEERVYVSYQAQGRHYVKRLGYYRADFYEGKRIQIYYDRLNPGKIGSEEGNVFVVVGLTLMGIAFLWVGISMKIKHHLGPIHRDRLREKGRRIEADYEGTGDGVTVNGSSGCYLKCRWLDVETGKQYQFRSIEICGDPTLIMREKGITKVPVLINPKNPKQYYVDMEELHDRVFPA